MKKLIFTVFLFTSFVSITGQCKIITDFVVVPEVTADESSITNQDLMLFFPNSVAVGTSDSNLKNQILDKSFQSFLSGKMTPDAQIFKTVKAIEKSMQVEVALPKESKKDVEHKFGFLTQPFQKIIELKYSGLVDAKLNFKEDTGLTAQIDHKLGSGKTFRLQHLSGKNDEKSTVNLLWGW